MLIFAIQLFINTHQTHQVNAHKLLILIFFLSSLWSNANAGDPVRPVELKGPKTVDQKFVTQKPISHVNLNNQHSNNVGYNHSALYLPNKPSQSSDMVLLNYNMGRVLNLGHLVVTGIGNLPHITFTGTDRVPNSPPNNIFRKREIALVSSLSALCIAGIVLGPVINCKTRSVRYNKNGTSTYLISIAMNNELELTLKF